MLRTVGFIFVILGFFILTLLGVVALAFQGSTYATHTNVMNLGPSDATTEQKTTILLPPVLGGLSLAGGTLLLLAGRRAA